MATIFVGLIKLFPDLLFRFLALKWCVINWTYFACMNDYTLGTFSVIRRERNAGIGKNAGSNQAQTNKITIFHKFPCTLKNVLNEI